MTLNALTPATDNAATNIRICRYDIFIFPHLCSRTPDLRCDRPWLFREVIAQVLLILGHRSEFQFGKFL